MQLPPVQYDENSEFLLSATFSDAEDKELKATLEDKSPFRLDQVDGIYLHMHDKACHPYIPYPLRNFFFKKVHNTAHPEKRATLRQLTTHYVWPAKRSGSSPWFEECTNYQKGKIAHHNLVPSNAILPVVGKFTQMHLDLVRPLPLNE